MGFSINFYLTLFFDTYIRIWEPCISVEHIEIISFISSWFLAILNMYLF